MWSKDIERNHLQYMWTAATDQELNAKTTDEIHIDPSDAHEDAQDTEEIPSNRWNAFSGEGSDNE